MHRSIDWTEFFEAFIARTRDVEARPKSVAALWSSLKGNLLQSTERVVRGVSLKHQWRKQIR